MTTAVVSVGSKQFVFAMTAQGGGVAPPPKEPLPEVAGYKELKAELIGTDVQVNHLNQTAAFGRNIPKDLGLCNRLRGNAMTEAGSPHYEFHRSLETFWNQFRLGNAKVPTGARYGEKPTNAEYGVALEKALKAAGCTVEEAANFAAKAAAERAAYGLSESAQVPHVPRRFNQTTPSS